MRKPDAKPPDPRHHPVMLQIDRLYKAHNGGLPAPSMQRAARALSALLGANPKWPLEMLLRCVNNRFDSECINLALQPHSWIKFLPDYARGPLDGWGKPKKQRAPDYASGPQITIESERILSELEADLGIRRPGR